MIVVAVAVGLLAVAFTLVPLLRSSGADEPAPEPEESPSDRLAARRDVIYDNIRDLDFEFAMGKLTEEDHREVRTQLVSDAVTLVAELDTGSRDEVLDRWIEAEVEARRGRPARPAAKCRACGVEGPSGARFCDACGAELGGTCGRCGADLRPEARFCGACGSRQ